jgi:hypothetical protein
VHLGLAGATSGIAVKTVVTAGESGVFGALDGVLVGQFGSFWTTRRTSSRNRAAAREQRELDRLSRSNERLESGPKSKSASRPWRSGESIRAVLERLLAESEDPRRGRNRGTADSSVPRSRLHRYDPRQDSCPATCRHGLLSDRLPGRTTRLTVELAEEPTDHRLMAATPA